MKTFVITWQYIKNANTKLETIINGFTIINEENRREAIKGFYEYIKETEYRDSITIKTINKLNSKFGVVFNDTF